MTTFTNQTPKTAIANATNTQKSTVTLGRVVKAGQGWLYDQIGLTYDGATDPVTGLPVNYDSLGTAPSWSNIPKT